MRFLATLLPLLLAAGCSTALSSVKGPDLTEVGAGQTRAEVERVVGRADHVEPLPTGGERIAYRVKLDRRQAEGLRWDSADAAFDAAYEYAWEINGGDEDLVQMAQFTVVAAAFAISEVFATGKEVNRLHERKEFDFVVEYDRNGCVRSTSLTRPGETSAAAAPGEAVVRSEEP